MDYSKNVWNPYDKTKSEEENMTNGSIITAKKMKNIEDGVKSANKPLKIGKVDTVESGTPVIVSVVEKEEYREMNFSFPEPKVDPEIISNEIDKAKDEIVKSTSKIYFISEGSIVPDIKVGDLVLEIELEDDDVAFDQAVFTNMVFDNTLHNQEKAPNFGLYSNNNVILPMASTTDNIRIEDGKLTVNIEPDNDTKFFADTDK